MYLYDYQQFHNRGLLQSSSVVVADNVIFADIIDYQTFVKDLALSSLENSKENSAAAKKIVTTKTIDCMVEYSSSESMKYGVERLKDGVEVTEYV
mmetsp:Transcript_30547/g.30870  ORF Transcript_30547/g.30870 Transcript_30547/m.30870 type:complete len:95 (-) Transcript_30547:2099-2383(-)